VNIIYQEQFSQREKQECSVAEFVASHLQERESYYGSGVAEEAAANARKNSIAIGLLVDMLASKGELTVEQVTEIAGGWYQHPPEFAP
jgi:hypothetical protein